MALCMLQCIWKVFGELVPATAHIHFSNGGPATSSWLARAHHHSRLEGWRTLCALAGVGLLI